jgi:hypothetical protein
MEIAKVNGVELEYEMTGAGEPVLFISSVLADGFLPLLAEPALTDRYQLIRYHKRGWVGSTPTPPPVSVADHAATIWTCRAPTSPATPPAGWSPPSWHSTIPEPCTR